MDIESAQIVNMALNLSESRRLASRRSVAQTAPPKLTPLIDSATGGTLRQHLQQQRRLSRTISPRPDRSPRVASGRVLTPLQSAFEPEGSYRYHFSQSTLDRAQKAKIYLELMAQYRRVLEFLPPLEVSRTKLPAASPPETPNDSVQVFRLSSNDSDAHKVGRPYNPLQYIRNRKVRARERKAIDGAGQGFNEVIRVSEWVDEVAKWVATGQSRTPGNPALPTFFGVQISSLQSSPPSINSRAAVTPAKPKRPRVDWAIEPADMIADIYWLELDDNKKLIEDRHWRRVFPQGPHSTRPLSRDDMQHMATPGSNKDSSEWLAPSDKGQAEQPASKSDQDVLSSAKDRAQQRLRALKGSSHSRQSSMVHNRDLLHINRGSMSESSDTDTDRRRRLRTVLEKQMEDMIAKEQMDIETQAPYDHAALRMKFASISPMTPERDPAFTSPDANSSTGHRRKDSRVDFSDLESKNMGLKQRPAPGQSSGRASLEVLSRGRQFSVDYESSQPNSPDIRPRDGGLLPVIGMDLSPFSSRPSSPSRNPLTKVKSIFRERSKERVNDACASAEDFETPAPKSHNPVSSPEADSSVVSSPDRRISRSPLGRIVTRGTDLTHRSHKSTGSVKLRAEDVGGGFRSLFRGPRIDTVLRSGVSKLGDMVWRKDPGAVDDQDSSTSSSSSSEDSEDEARGRSRGPRILRRTNGRDPSAQNGKGSLEPTPELPQFVSTTGYAMSPDGKLVVHPPAQPLSRRSSRFDLLKPPRIDVHSASPSQSPPPLADRKHEPGASGTELQKLTDTEVDESRQVEIIDADTAPSFHQQQSFSSAHSARHWSIANRGSSVSAPTSAISKRELARLRALILSSGIQATEIDRRAKEAPPFACPKSTPPEIARLCPGPASQMTCYPLAARALVASIETSATEFDTVSFRFAFERAPSLERRVEELRLKLAGELTDLTHGATDQADEANHDLASGQRIKVKAAVDHIQKMLRRRRRRFRWVRRAGWLGVEWVLVGFMWWVWFVVMIARIFVGVAKGVLGFGRWLLWL
ncbi:hypothetical protein QBC42DRAFT_268037 [Cladorrhinum samala]|uniref:Uncharacterized protein n=1 Tax=Cladorrhinum samala TaxID=585594 RepID=A0AAV9HRG6_9PEZI|nr:hypothetical protein QBC42DRAFT_268037 [Cladorrhinum samala]